MEQIATKLYESGWTLRSGAAPGADTAFERGATKGMSDYSRCQVFLPWEGFELRKSHQVTLGRPQPEAFVIAARFHPAWGTLKEGAKSLHARNVHQVLGRDVTNPDPSKFLICWTEDAKGGGGTGQAIRVARAYGVPRSREPGTRRTPLGMGHSSGRHGTIGAMSEVLAEHVDPTDTPIRRTTPSTTTGLGAWANGYYHQGMVVANDRVAAGVLAFKHALIDNGFTGTIDINARAFGRGMGKQTKAFQRANGLEVDGVIGQVTARYLFHFYTYASETRHSIPNHLVTRLGNQESGNDPVAQGYFDPGDEGWGQIHMAAHPSITVAQAWSPSFAVEFTAQGLAGFYANQVADWDGAVAAWNCGQYYAKLWVQAGKPAVGGPILAGQDMWTRATHYVTGVKSQPA